MNLDRFCQFFIVSLLPILWLPFEWLLHALVAIFVFMLFAIWQQNRFYIALTLLQAVSYVQILTIAMNANEVTTQRVQEKIIISQILKQDEYQTAIATRENGKRIYLTWQSKIPLELEATYQADFTLRPISSRLNLGNFDRQKWYFAQHIQQIATIRHAQKIEHSAKSFRVHWLERVKAQTADLHSQGLLLALGFGERAWLKTADWEKFKQTSTAHLIAISGLHIGLAFGIGLLLGKGFQWLCWRLGNLQAVRSNPRFTQVVGLLFAISYSYLAGFSIPTVRAMFAICLVLCVQWLRRHFTPAQFWWRVVALLLLFDPITLLSDSFWLSILAVASLIFWYRYFPLKAFFSEKHKKRPKAVRLLLGLLHLQIGIWLVFSPVQLFFFGGISLFALPANLLIVPLYSLFLVPIILFSLLTDNLFLSWQFADWIVQMSLLLLEPLSDGWQDLNIIHQWHLLSWNVAILLGIFCWLYKPKKWWVICIFPLLFNRILFIYQWFFPHPEVQWINFDVGQGLAMALVYQEKNQRKAVIYDTGSSWQGGSMAQIEIIPYLKRQNIDVVAIFVSHSDNDHSGGVSVLQSAFPTADLFTSQQDWGEPCVANKRWDFGGIFLESIYPKALVERAENQHSCVLLVTIGKHKLLFTGDIGVQQERAFAYQLDKIDFLQVGHHGSNTSTSHTLLAKTQPNIAIISAGRWNPWKLPSLNIEKRLNQYNVTYFNTANVGMVTVDFYSDTYQLKTARTKLGPWYKGLLGMEKNNTR